MYVFPEDKPVIRGIHASYVDMSRLIEFYQCQMEAGCIVFRCETAQGILFFQGNEIVNGDFRTAGQQLSGLEAITRLTASASQNGFFLDILEIDKDQLEFWSGVQAARTIYSNLSTEFTDLKKLLLKMTGEKLTGYIDVAISAQHENGRIFLVQGRFVGGTYSWLNHRLSRAKKDLEKLISKTKTTEGVFNVYKVGSPENSAPEMNAEADDTGITQEALAALEALLSLGENILAKHKKTTADFHTLLKKHFVNNVDRYTFLDPFAAEFEYRHGKVSFHGDADEKSLIEGVLVSIQGVLQECRLEDTFAQQLDQWRSVHASVATRWGF